MVKLYLQKLHPFPIISKKTNSRNKKSEDFKFDLNGNYTSRKYH